MGGAETSLLLMVKHLHTQFLISVACPVGSPLSKALASFQIDSHKLPVPPNHAYWSPSSVVYLLKTSYCIIRTVLKANPDMIHANSFYAGAVSVLAAVITRKKLVLHARDLAKFGFLSRFFCWFCERVIAVSYAVRNALVKEGVNPDKIRVVYNGVDTTCIDQSSDKASLPNAPNLHKEHAFVFAHVGQFVPWKNQIAFLKAASRIASTLPDARFVLVGDDIFRRNSVYKSNLLSYAENSPIAERIGFLGWHKNMNEVWPKISCLVHTAERESFGRVIIEAMAHKIPVIAVGTCGPGEIIQNDKTGILVRFGDIKELSDAMLKIAQNAQFASRLVAEAYEHVISKFTSDQTALHVQEIYREVLAI